MQHKQYRSKMPSRVVTLKAVIIRKVRLAASLTRTSTNVQKMFKGIGM